MPDSIRSCGVLKTPADKDHLALGEGAVRLAAAPVLDAERARAIEQHARRQRVLLQRDIDRAR